VTLPTSTRRCDANAGRDCPAALDTGTETLGEHVTGTWAATHAATLALKTQLHCSSLYDHRLRPYLASITLRDLSPETISRWQADRLGAGAGPIAVRHAMDLAQYWSTHRLRQDR